jgi:hypothetical protein
MAREKNGDKKNYVILYGGHIGDKHAFGTGFYISRYSMDNLLAFEPVNERICKVRMKLKYYNLTLISLHALTEKKRKYPKNNCIVLWKRHVMQFPILTWK